MEKEKFSIIKVTIVSLLLTSIIFFIFMLLLGFYSSRHAYRNPHLISQEAQAQNNQFEAYFGTHVSATEVKQLLSLIGTNNIVSSKNNIGENNGVEKTVYVNSQDSIDSSSIEGGIQNGKYYTVEVLNDKNVAPCVSIQESNAGYYENGFIRNISIKLNSTNNSNTVIQQNTTVLNSINQLTINTI